jgi:hypothetical protein
MFAFWCCVLMLAGLWGFGKALGIFPCDMM